MYIILYIYDMCTMHRFQQGSLALSNWDLNTSSTSLHYLAGHPSLAFKILPVCE